jgi:hypothetical protein
MPPLDLLPGQLFGGEEPAREIWNAWIGSIEAALGRIASIAAGCRYSAGENASAQH